MITPTYRKRYLFAGFGLDAAGYGPRNHWGFSLLCFGMGRALVVDKNATGKPTTKKTMNNADHISNLVKASVAASRHASATARNGSPEEIEAARYDARIARAAAQRALRANIARCRSEQRGVSADDVARTIHACRA